jgi:hypothetical protein
MCDSVWVYVMAVLGCAYTQHILLRDTRTRRTNSSVCFLSLSLSLPPLLFVSAIVAGHKLLLDTSHDWQRGGLIAEGLFVFQCMPWYGVVCCVFITSGS